MQTQVQIRVWIFNNLQVLFSCSACSSPSAFRRPDTCSSNASDWIVSMDQTKFTPRTQILTRKCTQSLPKASQKFLRVAMTEEKRRRLWNVESVMELSLMMTEASLAKPTNPLSTFPAPVCLIMCPVGNFWSHPLIFLFSVTVACLVALCNRWQYRLSWSRQRKVSIA